MNHSSFFFVVVSPSFPFLIVVSVHVGDCSELCSLGGESDQMRSQRFSLTMKSEESPVIKGVELISR